MSKSQVAPGSEIDTLGIITFTLYDDGYLRRHAVRLALWEFESCRYSQEARKAWIEAGGQAMPRRLG